MSENDKNIEIAENEVKKNIQKRIEKILSLSSKSQKDFAEMCGIDANDISKAKNRGELSVAKAIKISKATGYSLDYIYGNSFIASVPQSAFNIIKNNMYPRRIQSNYAGKPYWVHSLDISKALEKYFVSLYKIQENRELIGEFASNIQDRIENEFLQEIQQESSERKTYVLLSDEFIEETKLYEKLEPVKPDEITTNNEVFDKFIDVPDLSDISEPHDI